MDSLRVAVQGDPGCFSHAAALAHFGTLDLVPCRDFAELFAAVLEGRADRGCVPVENALHGAVSESLDLLVQHPLCAVGEAYVRVEMCLAVRPGTTASELTAVASHPVALRQCRRFFRRHPHVREVVAADTAGSIRALMATAPPVEADPAYGREGGDAGEPEQRTVGGWDGAIGPALAAELYGAELLMRGIEDHPRNFTRFLIVAREEDAVPHRGRDAKASLAFTLPHRVGSLHGALGILADAALDLTRLESRPIPGRPWEYRFYADIRSAAGGAWAGALAALGGLATDVRVIGVYPEADAP